MSAIFGGASARGSSTIIRSKPRSVSLRASGIDGICSETVQPPSAAVTLSGTEAAAVRFSEDPLPRTEIVLPKRFQIREVRVLPLALTYVVPATAEDVRP